MTTSSTSASGVVEWLSNDPIGISGGLNQYVFCDSNPVGLRDPSGLASLTASERVFVQFAIDAVKQDPKYSEFGVVLQRKLEHGMIESIPMGRDTHGQVRVWRTGVIWLNSADLKASTTHLPGVARTAGTLVHEYGHTLQFSNLPRKVVYGAFVKGVLSDLLRIPVGRDQFGQWHTAIELGPHRIGNDVQQRVFEALLEKVRQEALREPKP